ALAISSVLDYLAKSTFCFPTFAHSIFPLQTSTVINAHLKGLSILNKKLTKFLDALPIPKILKPLRKDKNEAYYEVEMTEFRHKMHRDLRPTRLWGYNGQFPGPIIDVSRGKPIQVKWENKLPDKHFLPIDKSFHDLDELPEVRTVTHLHGSETKPES